MTKHLIIDGSVNEVLNFVDLIKHCRLNKFPGYRKNGSRFSKLYGITRRAIVMFGNVTKALQSTEHTNALSIWHVLSCVFTWNAKTLEEFKLHLLSCQQGKKSFAQKWKVVDRWIDFRGRHITRWKTTFKLA